MAPPAHAPRDAPQARSGPKRSGRVLIVLVTAVFVVAGCRSRQAARPVPPPVETREPAVTRIGVVNLDTVAQAHPRRAELDVLNNRINAVEAEIATAPLPPPPPVPDLRPALDAEAKRLRAEFEKELVTMHEERRRQLEAYAASLREQQAAKFEALRNQVNDEGKQAVEEKRVEIQKQLSAAELEIREEYRYPILNLRLRAEVAGLSSEQEARDVLRQIQALQQEREERLQAKSEELAKTFDEFQKAKEAELTARLKAAQETLTAEGQQQLAARERQLETEFKTIAARREQEFKERIETQRRALIRAAEQQLRGRQGTFLRDVSARTQQLRAELTALQEQRARLEDSILAEVKIEVATIAQQEKLDVVLARALTNVGAIDITAKVVQKFKR